MKAQTNMVRIVFLLCSFFFFLNSSAQAPQKMSYQAVIRNASNALVSNATVGVKVSILQTSATGSVVYSETHTPTTNANGLATFEIGNGTLVSGNFATVNWANGPYFIKTQTDPTGGTSYTISGTSQLLSVPFALFAASGNPGPQGPQGEFPSGTNVGDMQYWNGTNWIMVPIGQPGQFLQINESNIPTWKGGGYASVTTFPAQNIFANVGYSGGHITNSGITSNGGSGITQKGVVYGTVPNPDFSNAIMLPNTSDVPGDFYSEMGLYPNTTFYVRAYVVNSAGVSFGNQITFTTPDEVPPTVTTTSVASITGGTASCNAVVTNAGGSPTYYGGVCWSTNPNPTITDNYILTTASVGSYTSQISGLAPNTTYYVRAFGTNDYGENYGNQLSFATSSQLSIGSSYQGGIVVQLDGSGIHGKIASLPVLIASNNWGCAGFSVSGADGTAVGTGVQNTIDIAAANCSINSVGLFCNDLVLNSYSDWYLPSKDELALLIPNRNLLPDFNYHSYYSSSEISTFNVWALDLLTVLPGTELIYQNKSNGDNKIDRIIAYRNF